jgi:hypothetical protein
LEQAAERLMQVRRETGCLELHCAPGAPAAQQHLVARFAELSRQEFGT